MNKSKYLEAFKVVPELKDKFKLIGNYILVENIPAEEMRTKGGIIVPLDLETKNQVNSVSANLPQFVHVLAVGEGYYDDTTEVDVPLDVKPGDIIMVGKNSVKWLPVLPIPGYKQFDIGLTSESEMQMKFSGVEGYDAVFAAIEAAARGSAKEAEGKVGAL